MIEGFNATDLIQSRIYSEISTKEFFNNATKTIDTRSEAIGKIITRLRLKRGFTQKELAQAIGLAQTTYAGYETGRHEPGTEIMIRLADIYNVSMDYITGRYIDKQELIIEEYIRMQENEDEEIEAQIDIMDMRNSQKAILEDIKKRGPYNRAKKAKK